MFKFGGRSAGLGAGLEGLFAVRALSAPPRIKLCISNHQQVLETLGMESEATSEVLSLLTTGGAGGGDEAEDSDDDGASASASS